MKKTAAFTALFFAAALSLGSMELTVLGGMGNGFFDTKSLNPVGGGEFKGSLYPFFRVQLDETVSDFFSFSGALERDPVLRNRSWAEAEFSAGFVSVSVGPVLGLFNSRESVVRPGIQAGIRLDFPGIIFAGFNAGSTLGSLRAEGDYEARHGEFALGFWLPNIVNTISVSEKKYDSRETGTIDTLDAIRRYQYRAGIYAKGFPFEVQVDFGYETLTRRVTDASVVETDTYNIIFLGAETTVGVKPGFSLIFGVETPVYSWGQKPLEKKDKLLLFQAHAGFMYTLTK
ncbi:MAG: hypothetical protein LBI67_01110 [Treponema sp.]|jgi:hypothetical protein|nr:hypothetical protein [Treponema sp.]